jgi:hypothetical protein
MHLELFAYEISDDSANYHVNKGGIVVVTDFDESGIVPQPGDIMVFAEEAEDGRFNTSVREYLKPIPLSDYDQTTDRILLFSPNNAGVGWDLEIPRDFMEEAASRRGLGAAGFIGLVIGVFNVAALDRIPPRKPPDINPQMIVRRAPRRPPPPPTSKTAPE